MKSIIDSIKGYLCGRTEDCRDNENSAMFVHDSHVHDDAPNEYLVRFGKDGDRVKAVFPDRPYVTIRNSSGEEDLMRLTSYEVHSRADLKFLQQHRDAKDRSVARLPSSYVEKIAQRLYDLEEKRK